MKLIKSIKAYFSPEARIARKLRSAANIAGEHRYQIAFGSIGSIARTFEDVSKCQNQ